MERKMLISLFCLLFFVKDVSFTSECTKTKKISVSPGEPFTLDLDQDEVKDNVLVAHGTIIARIEKEGVLEIIDQRYKDIVTSTNFSFHLKYEAIGVLGQTSFTASVLYRNESTCLVHYFITVHGSGRKTNALLNQHFTLDFDSKDVDYITWLNSNGTPIASTRPKSCLNISHRDYDGTLSVIDVSLRKHNVTLEDKGNYTAKVLFRNGTEFSQYYSVDVSENGWRDVFLQIGQYITTSMVIAAFLLVLAASRFEFLSCALSRLTGTKRRFKNSFQMKIGKHEEAAQEQELKTFQATGDPNTHSSSSSKSSLY